MEEIINSVMQSPENTNPNVLRGQLQNIGGGSGSGVEDIEGTFLGQHKYTVNKPMAEIAAAMQQGARIRASQQWIVEGTTMTTSYYLTLAATAYQNSTITTLIVYSPIDEASLGATESGGITTFEP